MKIKYWIPAISLLFVLNLLFIAGCSQATTKMTSSPVTTILTTPDVPTIAPSDAYNLIQKNIGNPNFVILDVRTVDEFNGEYITSAINIDFYSPQFKADVSKLDKNKQYLIYCRTGVRGAFAVQIMIGLGFKKIQNISGGITAWIQDGYPTSGLTTTGSTPAQPITTTPTTVPAQLLSGLQLRVSVNTTSLNSGEALQISVSEYNILATTNEVSSGKKWGVDGLTLGACPNVYVQPFGVAVFHGHYTAQNILQATPLDIFAPVACPNYIRSITGYIFLPNSINATVIPAACYLTPATPMSAIITVNGVYTQGNQLNPLDPGVYTIVAGDEWGTLDFLYVSVE
jgi:rhodanese-related sulfurtransferase